MWEIEGDLAKLRDDGVHLNIDLKRPGNGVQHAKFKSSSLTDSRLLSIEPDPPTPESGESIIERYVRDDDLIVIYTQTPDRSVRPHYQWRWLHSADWCGVELTLSMQTSLLDSNPRATAVCHVPGSECFVYADEQWKAAVPGHDGVIPPGCGLFLFRPPVASFSYAEFVFPADFQGAAAHSLPGGVEIRYELFPEFLEKGVIRKARVRGLFFARENDQDLALDAHRELAAAAPPLTT